MPEARQQDALDATASEEDTEEDVTAPEETPTSMAKGDRVRINSSGKHGTIVGFLSGFVLVQTDGSTRDFGYLPREITPEGTA